MRRADREIPWWQWLLVALLALAASVVVFAGLVWLLWATLTPS